MTPLEEQIFKANQLVSEMKRKQNVYEEQCFSQSGKLLKSARPSTLRLYHHWHGKVMEAQKELAQLLGQQRKIDTAATLARLKLEVGCKYLYPPANMVGTLTWDAYGYTLLVPSG